MGFVERDTLLLAVGLIPESELILKAVFPLCFFTAGLLWKFFVCGNVAAVFDFVGYVTLVAERAGREAQLAGSGKGGVELSRMEWPLQRVRGKSCTCRNSAASPELTCFVCRPSCRLEARKEEVGLVPKGAARGREHAIAEKANFLAVFSRSVREEGLIERMPLAPAGTKGMVPAGRPILSPHRRRRLLPVL
jgi:hypothetical protein